MLLDNLCPIAFADGYKTGHYTQYPKDTTLIVSNWTARKSRIPYAEKVVAFGFRAFLTKLNYYFRQNFFKKDENEVVSSYSYFLKAYLGLDNPDVEHIRELHKLGYLPLAIAAVPEGTLCKIGAPQLVIWNTHPSFYWLVGYLETWFSLEMWKPSTSATIAYYLRELCLNYCNKTNSEAIGFIPWQCHDFSMRGMDSIEAAAASGAGHLLSFNGSDTIPADYYLNQYYNSKGPVSSTVPATEHSIASSTTVTLGDNIDSFEVDEKGIITKIIMKDGSSYLF